MQAWTPLSVHGQVLVYLARCPDALQTEISRRLPMDLRTVVRVIKELRDAGVVHVYRRGRRNVYEVVLDAPLSTPLLADFNVSDLLSGLARSAQPSPTEPQAVTACNPGEPSGAAIEPLSISNGC